MTAPSTPDLAARILAAIERVELTAGAATAGPWRHNPNKHWRKPGTCWYEEAVFTGPAGADATCVAGTGPSDHPQAMADARHIALNDPPTVLRRCAADRKLVDMVRRGAAGHPGRCENYEGQDPAEYTRSVACVWHIEWSETAFVVPELRALVLRTLAEGYGITVEAS